MDPTCDPCKKFWTLVSQHHPAIHARHCGATSLRVPARAPARLGEEAMTDLAALLATAPDDSGTGAAPRADDRVAQWWADYGSSKGQVRLDIRDALITHYAPLVTHVAARMIVRLPDTVELADLVSYGMFGLIDAV